MLRRKQTRAMIYNRKQPHFTGIVLVYITHKTCFTCDEQHSYLFHKENTLVELCTEKYTVCSAHTFNTLLYINFTLCRVGFVSFLFVVFFLSHVFVLFLFLFLAGRMVVLHCVRFSSFDVVLLSSLFRRFYSTFSVDFI